MVHDAHWTGTVFQLQYYSLYTKHIKHLLEEVVSHKLVSEGVQKGVHIKSRNIFRIYFYSHLLHLICTNEYQIIAMVERGLVVISLLFITCQKKLCFDFRRVTPS